MIIIFSVLIIILITICFQWQPEKKETYNLHYSLNCVYIAGQYILFYSLINMLMFAFYFYFLKFISFSRKNLRFRKSHWMGKALHHCLFCVLRMGW